MIETLRVFGFLLGRTALNAARRRLARLREPRYLVGGIATAVYFYFWIGRTLFGMSRTGQLQHARAALPPGVEGLVIVLAAAALALGAAVLWIFRAARPALQMTEAEVAFLAPAPLPRHALLNYGLLRGELGLVFVSFALGLMFGRIFQPSLFRAWIAAWLLISTIYLHDVALTFWKARAGETTTAGRVGVHGLTLGAGFALGGAVIAWLAWGARLLLEAAPGGALAALAPWTAGFVPRMVLWPFRAILAPGFAADGAAFAAALPAVLALIALHYVSVVRMNVRYEEAALEGARRGVARRERMQRGRIRPQAAESRRAVVPFALRSQGAPELAVAWKNLLSPGRQRLARVARGWVFAWIAAFGVASMIVARDPRVWGPVVPMVGACLALVAIGLAMMLPMAYRNDFREDLERAAVLRAWPLSPARLVAAELLAPLILSATTVWAMLGCGTALVLAGRGRAAGPLEAIPVGWTLPALAGLAVLLPAFSAIVLVTQNAAVLAFPAWFPPGPQTRGFDRMGSRLISFLGTGLVMTVAVLPAALVGVPAGWLGVRAIGPWALVPAAALGTIPIWAIVGAGIGLLGRLFERFDVSAESWT